MLGFLQNVLMINFEFRSANSPSFEKADCTVRALAISTDSPYYDAYKILSQAGRKSNQGFYIEKFFKKCNFALGHRFTKLRFKKSITLQKFIKLFPKGIFYIRKRGHVFVIKDGTVFDTRKPGPYTKVLMAWCVERVI